MPAALCQLQLPALTDLDLCENEILCGCRRLRTARPQLHVQHSVSRSVRRVALVAAVAAATSAALHGFLGLGSVLFVAHLASGLASFVAVFGTLVAQTPDEGYALLLTCLAVWFDAVLLLPRRFPECGPRPKRGHGVWRCDFGGVALFSSIWMVAVWLLYKCLLRVYHRLRGHQP